MTFFEEGSENIQITLSFPFFQKNDDVTHVDHGLNDSECSLNAVFSA